MPSFDSPLRFYVDLSLGRTVVEILRESGLVVWLRDESLEDFENLPPPEVIAQEIVQDLEAALAEFSALAESLASPADTSS